MRIEKINMERVEHREHTGKDIERMEQETTDLYSIKHYKEMISKWADELIQVPEKDIPAAIARKAYVIGYMAGAEEMIDYYVGVIYDSLVDAKSDIA